MKSLFCYILFCIIIFSSCNFCKTDNYPVQVKGHVIEYYTSKPINNYFVDIAYPDSHLFGSRDVHQGSTRTDTNGYFYFSFKSENCRNYYIEGFDENKKYTSIDRMNLDLNNNNVLVFKVKEFKVLELEIDIVSKIKQQICVEADSAYYFDSQKDTIIYQHLAVPDENYAIDIINSGGYLVLEKEVFIENKDTTYYKLVY